MTDNINHPAHYKASASGIETIEVTRLMGFSLGNAVKYISRRDHKGSASEDLQKAIWYLNDEMNNAQRSSRTFTDSELSKVVTYVDGEKNKAANQALRYIAAYYFYPFGGKGLLELAIVEVKKI